MPYIAPEDRPSLDPLIESLVEAINTGPDGPYEDGAKAGRLNYVCTRIANQVLPPDRYARAALVTGVLENVKQELYRRAVSPYEDLKITENGDVIEYER